MQFVIPTSSGETLYKPGNHTRDELKFAFKSLHRQGDKGILIGAIYGELYPGMAKRSFDAWKKQHGFI